MSVAALPQKAIANRIDIAQKLPTRLLTFFARYPPQSYSTRFTASTPDNPAKPNPLPDSAPTSLTEALPQSDTAPSPNLFRNPFAPWQNPFTKRWRGPAIGLRRQAELYRIAENCGVEELLPPSIKSREYRLLRAEEKGNRVKGTGVGQKVKGHKWERTMKGKLEERRTAMMEMPELVRTWKEVSLYLPLTRRDGLLTIFINTERTRKRMEEIPEWKSEEVMAFLARIFCLRYACWCT